MESGTIYEDGKIIIDNVPMSETRIMGINNNFIAIYHPGGYYKDTGGRNYISPWIDVRELEELSIAERDGLWRFKTKHAGFGISFPSQPSTGAPDAMSDLETWGATYSKHLAENRKA